MKSAYELAMERLEKEQGPARKLTDEERARIAEIDRKYEGQLAETKLAFDAKQSAAASPAELEAVQKELADQLAYIEANREKEKNAVWNG